MANKEDKPEVNVIELLMELKERAARIEQKLDDGGQRFDKLEVDVESLKAYQNKAVGIVAFILAGLGAAVTLSHLAK